MLSMICVIIVSAELVNTSILVYIYLTINIIKS